MYLYEIGYQEEAGIHSVILSHRRQFTQEELEKKIQKAVVKTLEYAIECGEEVIKAYQKAAEKKETDWDQYYKAKDFFYFSENGIYLEAVFEHVIEELKQKGFTEADFEARGFYPGPLFSLCFNSHREYKGKIGRRLTESIPQELKDRALEIGKQREELESERLKRWAEKEGHLRDSSIEKKDGNDE